MQGFTASRLIGTLAAFSSRGVSKFLKKRQTAKNVSRLCPSTAQKS
jgi:hypothetical protein